MSYPSVLLYTDYRASIAGTPTKRKEWHGNAHLDPLYPEGDQLEFVERTLGVSSLADLENAPLMKQYLPFAEFLFGLENFESRMFSTLTFPVSCRSVIFCHR